MFLSDIDIKEAVKAGDVTLEPFNPKKLQPASYDIRLGNIFIVNDPHTTSFIDPVKGIHPNTRKIELKDGDTFILHPGVSILRYSKEFFGSDHYLIEVNGKSSLARIGLLVHNSAGLVNPGHFLNIALELCNLNNVPIILRPGMDIAQLTFSPLSSRTKQNYKETGRYHLDNIVGYVPPKQAKEAKKTKKSKK